MAQTQLNYQYNKVTGEWLPAQYPGDSADKWTIPEDIKADFGRLNSIIETKYSREYLKICAFYNKLFPSLKTSSWSRTSYNVPAFTSLDQERTDTSTGNSANYLKQIIDQTVSRIGTMDFEPMLLSDTPTLEYIIYKDEVERLLRKVTREIRMSHMTMEIFHDAAILGYSHVLIDPYTHRLMKANDYEIGLYEAQFARDDVKQLLYRDYSFPVTSLVPYLAFSSPETIKKIVEEYGQRMTVDFKMYFDCPSKQVYVMINGTALDPIEYPFDKVQMVTFSWDVGFNGVTSTSLFDQLYSSQRELNKVKAKVQQLVRMYKGPVPVFNADVDLAMKAITNGSGEALYVDSTRPMDSLMSVINFTPLDTNLDAVITNIKTEMYELAGIQQVSLDAENIRSASTLVAMSQIHDTVFQAQLSGISKFIADTFRMLVHYYATTNVEASVIVDWASVDKLLGDALIELTPVHVNDPLGNKGNIAQLPQPDYQQIQVARTVIAVINGHKTFTDIPYVIDLQQLKIVMAATMVKLDALNIEVPETMQQFMIAAFLNDVSTGLVQL